MMLARENSEILQNHHAYLRKLHAGDDSFFLGEKERRHEQYILPLKQIH